MRVTRSISCLDSTKRLTKFVGRFARELLTKYGGVLGEPWAFDASVPASARRPLRLPPPEQSWCTTASTWTDSEPYHSWLRLTRYHGGDKGPVVLAPGFGMSTGAYVADTIGTNITEFLYEDGYDVWLFDPRWSPDLPSARDSFSIDDVARADWPTAVSRVRECTGSDAVQVVAHCVGSMSLLMAVLAGMTGVRSAVCSQVTLHPVATWFQHQKVAARIPELLQNLGYRTISPDLHRTVGDVALDTALRLSPIQADERCSSAVCRWIFAFYGPTHRHEQLNAATHADLGRLFGVADLDALKHIGNMIKVGRSVDSHGNDTYLPNHARLDFPVLFLAGADNRIFLPDTSLRTQQWLQESNPKLKDLYERILLPDYAHLDGFIGRRAVADVYPLITRYLERT